MVVELMKRGIVGIGFAGIFTFIALTIMKIIEVEASVDEVWLNMLGSLIVGIYFSFASFIFDKNEWSLLKQLGLHFTLSIVVYFALAFGFGWVPADPISISIAVVVFVIIYLIFWFSIRSYLKKMASSMNNAVK
ncbi:DUF3021 domain-containing protein [Pontibacillus yanchengensis]|uniref:DUF3021 domain-containing protein n=1 Tax=Pontibacillus yanchengensis Y32 TaxID=1385514 RepID=A0A0A2TF06_9BACI|nr:DUF3021 domain-containing protein [Pontibacillus yanchengensis]KGP72706.1 hypothetical protein N782_10625 [Pontibacillus yanchengensis Y32]